MPIDERVKALQAFTGGQFLSPEESEMFVELDFDAARGVGVGEFVPLDELEHAAEIVDRIVNMQDALIRKSWDAAEEVMTEKQIRAAIAAGYAFGETAYDTAPHTYKGFLDF